MLQIEKALCVFVSFIFLCSGTKATNAKLPIGKWVGKGDKSQVNGLVQYTGRNGKYFATWLEHSKLSFHRILCIFERQLIIRQVLLYRISNRHHDCFQCNWGVGKSLCGDMLRRYHQTKTLAKSNNNAKLSPSYVYDSCQLLLLLQFSPLLSILAAFMSFACIRMFECLSVFEANANLCSDAFCQRLKSRVKVAPDPKSEFNNS